MKNMMQKSVRCLAATLFAFAFAFAANAEEWFNGGIAADWPAAESMSGGEWDEDTIGDSEFAEGVLKVDAAETALAFTADEAANVSENMAVVNTTVKFTAFDGEDGISAVALPGAEAKGALIVLGADGTEGSSAAYYGLMKVSAVNAWVKLTGATPDVDNAVAVTVSIKYENSTAYVQYKAGDTVLKTVDDTSDGFYPFVTETEFTQGYAVGTVCYKGVGEVTSLVGTQESLNYSFTVGGAPAGVNFTVWAGTTQLTSPYAAAPGSTITVKYEADGAYVLNKTSSEFTLSENDYDYDIATDGELTVCEAVATTGENEGLVYYASVADAIAAEAGEIALISNVTENISIAAGQEAVFAFGDKQLTGTITVEEGGSLTTVSGIYTVDVQEFCAEGTVAIEESDVWTVQTGIIFTYESAHDVVAPDRRIAISKDEWDSGYTFVDDDLPELSAQGFIFNGWIITGDAFAGYEEESFKSIDDLAGYGLDVLTEPENLAFTASWTEESGPEPIPVDDGVEITISDKELEDMGFDPAGTQTPSEFLEVPQNNGLKRWQNYALGLDGDDETAQPEVTTTVDDASGKITVNFADADSLKGGVEAVPYVIDFNNAAIGFNSEDAPLALTDGKNTSDVGQAANIGVHKIPGAKLVLVSVPYGSIDGEPLTVANFVSTYGLPNGLNGTKAYIWNGAFYDTWKIIGGAWSTGNAAEESAGTLKPGDTLWIEQPEPDDPNGEYAPIYTYGLDNVEEAEEVELGQGSADMPVWSLHANPKKEGMVSIADIVDGAADGDKISIPQTDGSFKDYYYDGDKKEWGYFTYSGSPRTKIWVPGGSIGAGVGFWYIAKGEEAKLNWDGFDE